MKTARTCIIEYVAGWLIGKDETYRCVVWQHQAAHCSHGVTLHENYRAIFLQWSLRCNFTQKSFSLASSDAPNASNTLKNLEKWRKKVFVMHVIQLPPTREVKSLRLLTKIHFQLEPSFGLKKNLLKKSLIALGNMCLQVPCQPHLHQQSIPSSSLTSNDSLHL